MKKNHKSQSPCFRHLHTPRGLKETSFTLLTVECFSSELGHYSILKLNRIRMMINKSDQILVN